MSDIYTAHIPVIKNVVLDGIARRIYVKTERDDNFLHVKTWSLSINQAVLDGDDVDLVFVKILHRSVVLSAWANAIRSAGAARRYSRQDEEKYYYPIAKFHVDEGDVNWADKLKQDALSWKLVGVSQSVLNLAARHAKWPGLR